MGNGKRQNSLLVEIMIAVLFFGLSAMVLLDVFATAYLQTTYAEACNAALAEAQNIAARVYVSDAPADYLNAEGFIEENGVWHRDGEGYELQVEIGRTQLDAGEMRTAQIVAIRDDDVLVTLPSAHYIPGEVAQ